MSKIVKQGLILSVEKMSVPKKQQQPPPQLPQSLGVRHSTLSSNSRQTQAFCKSEMSAER